MSALHTPEIVDQLTPGPAMRSRRWFGVLGVTALVTVATAWIVAGNGAQPAVTVPATAAERPVLFGSGYPSDYNPIIGTATATTPPAPVLFGSGYPAAYDPITGTATATTPPAPVLFGSGYPAAYDPITGTATAPPSPVLFGSGYPPDYNPVTQSASD